MEVDLHSPVVDWVIDYPATLPLFHELGIDYSCGGKSLEYACRQQGHDPQVVLQRLNELLSSLEKSHAPRSR